MLLDKNMEKHFVYLVIVWSPVLKSNQVDPFISSLLKQFLIFVLIWSLTESVTVRAHNFRYFQKRILQNGLISKIKQHLVKNWQHMSTSHLTAVIEQLHHTVVWIVIEQ